MPTEVNQPVIENENGENSCFYLNPVSLEGTDPETRAEGNIINAVITGLNACKFWSYWRKNIPLADSGIPNTEANQLNNYSTRYREIYALRETMVDMYQLRDAPSSSEEEQIRREGEIALTGSKIYEAVSQLMGPGRSKLPPSTRVLQIPINGPDDATIILDKLPPILHDLGNDIQGVIGCVGLAKRSKDQAGFRQSLERADLAITRMDAAMDTYADDLMEKFPQKEMIMASLEKSISTWGTIILDPLGINLTLDIPTEVRASSILFSKSILSRILDNIAQNTEKAYLDKFGSSGQEELEALHKLEDQAAREQQARAVYEKRPLYVRVGQSPDLKLLTFDFEDRGPGIQDPEILANKKFIKKRSVWTSQQSREKGKGQHGIGMASLDGILHQNYRGSLEPVENKSGAQVRLTLPAVRA